MKYIHVDVSYSITMLKIAYPRVWMWPGHAQDVAKQWSGYDQDVVRIWPACGNGVAMTWLECGQDVAMVCQDVVRM